MGDRLMTLAELAEYLQVPPETIYRWRKRGRGPCGYRMGRYVRFRRSEVEAWLETRRDDEPCGAPSGPLFRR